MKTFNLIATVTISIHTEVEAETLEKAIKEAEERSIEHYEHNYTRQRKEVWVSDEFDGMVTNIEEEQSQ